MNDPYQLDPEDLTNQPSPPRPKWFDDALKNLSRQYGTRVRLVWAPEVERFLWGARRKVYARYQRMKLLGWFQGAYVEVGGRQIFKSHRYHGRKAFPELNERAAHLLENGEWLMPDLHGYQIAWPRWIVELELDRQREKPFHDQERYEWDHETGQMVDALGPYPEEGKWASLFVICQHWVKCCQDANAQGRLCYGVGRAPVEDDLDWVRQWFKDRETEAKLAEPGTLDFARQVNREYRSLMDEEKRLDLKRKDLYREMVLNEIKPTLQARLVPMVDQSLTINPDPIQRAAREHLERVSKESNVIIANK